MVLTPRAEEEQETEMSVMEAEGRLEDRRRSAAAARAQAEEEQAEDARRALLEQLRETRLVLKHGEEAARTAAEPEVAAQWTASNLLQPAK